MTLFLPLEESTPLPSSPPFLTAPTDLAAQRQRVIRAIVKARRIVVICGAGISVRAGIPDFRSSEGLFHSLKRDNPREALSSGKDLFDASVFNSEHTTSLFCQMIAQLSDLSKAAQPTAFHQLLRTLDDRGKLLRVYTQNIDAIEQKCGLSYGVPEFEGKRGKGHVKGKPSPGVDEQLISESTTVDPQPSRHPSPAVETPRCIPLHGTLQSMHCQICTHSFPLDAYIPSLTSGQPPMCPECVDNEKTRQLAGKRARGIGKLRPSVVLYNEDHRDGEGVGEVVRRDLIKGKGRNPADLLLVVGTSLRVPGTKRMVREFSKAVRCRAPPSSAQSQLVKDGQTFGPSSPDATPPRRSPAQEDEPLLKSIYLNLDFPVPMREWDGVFDGWVQGDAQKFADLLLDEFEKEARVKEVAEEKKRKREEVAAANALAAAAQLEQERELSYAVSTMEVSIPVRKSAIVGGPSPAKKRKIMVDPLSPPSTPPEASKKAYAMKNSRSQQQQHQPKIMLKIPSTSSNSYSHPMSSTTMTVPRVVIPPRPSSSSTSMYPHLSYPFAPSTTSIYPTPQKTPPMKPNKHTKAGRRAIRQSQKAAKVASSSSESLSLSQNRQYHHSHHNQRQRSNISPAGLVAPSLSTSSASASTSALSSSSSLLSLVDSDVDIEDDVLPQVPSSSSQLQSSRDSAQTQSWLHNVPRDVSIAA
ncbi:DHS-like NAD/FAD-binding domain-containing protein [Pluteus cervinus]|uniref:DHS-like NAD/FAD-binding domain-containing protein n=1 Tax=Pluteus cervinus TaxID=181527 RepID=A0ACD3BAJ5_9AGAR|nr:DHS-like NAD/FAD-binding domain-containing protein [Pluteus cervinus]